MANGDTLWVCEPLAGQAPDTDPAGLAWINAADTHQIPVLTFDGGATHEEMDWKCLMPAHYDGGDLLVTIHWGPSADVSDSETCSWDGQFKPIKPDSEDYELQAYETLQSSGTAVAPVSASDLTTQTISFTAAQAGTPLAGEVFFFRLARDTTADSMVEDAEVLLVEIKENS